MPFCIEKFSTSLYLGFATGQSVDNPKLKYFNHFENPLDVCHVIKKLLKNYQEEFNSVTDVMLYDEKYDTFELCMKAILSRCVQLSKIPTYLNFMLVCTLITATVFSVCFTVKCYTFAKIASQSLIAVYERCYKELFDNIHEVMSLSSFCKEFNENESKYLLHRYEETKTQLISLKDINYKEFFLTKDEEKMLCEALIYAKTDSPCFFVCDESVSSDGEMNSEKKKNQNCDLCAGKCCNILLSYEKEVNSRDS